MATVAARRRRLDLLQKAHTCWVSSVVSVIPQPTPPRLSARTQQLPGTPAHFLAG